MIDNNFSLDGQNINSDSVGNNYNGSECQRLCSPYNSSTSACNSERFERRFSSQHVISSGPAVDFDSISDVAIGDMIETEPTSAILDFCKRKFLRPYVQLLGLVGLRPMTVDVSSCKMCLSHLQTFLIFCLLCIGYFLQYLTNFRRDRGFSQIYPTKLLQNPSYQNALDVGEILFVYIGPSLIHLFGYLFAIYVFRIADNEQLQNLVERVFLLSNAPKRLCISMWVYIFSGLIWLGFLTSYVILLASAQSDVIEIDWFGKPCTHLDYIVKIFLILTIFIHDLVQMVVITSYCIECYLLRLHLYNLKEKLVHHTIATLDWMREVLEFRKLLMHLNQRVATPIGFFTILNLSYAISGLIFLFKEYDFENCPIKIFILSIANFFMWLFIGLVPFFQAASVSRACQSTQASGHQIRVRPFVYHNTPADDLDSTLLFAASLNMSAKLYRMPINNNYLYFAIFITAIIILTLDFDRSNTIGGTYLVFFSLTPSGFDFISSV